MKITYLGHSGFCAELSDCVLVFDYAKGELPEWPASKAILVFVSHAHQDHFNWKILKLGDGYSRTHFFLGNDIRLGENWLRSKGLPPSVKERVTKLAGGRSAEYEDGDVRARVHALTSTDSGVGFVVEAEGKRIYHAGDLNWWHWEGEPAEENAWMAEHYKKEIDRLTGQHFDAAFVPLDPRLGDQFGYGMDYFLEKTDADAVFPMHLWEDYAAVDRYLKTPVGRGYEDRILRPERGGQVWNI